MTAASFATEVADTSRRAFVEHVMGMPVSIHLRGARGDVESPDARTAVAQAFSHLSRVDDVFSTWRVDSELMRSSRGDLDAADAHPWLAEVSGLCALAHLRTGGLFSPYHAGAYDPTGLVKGWAVEGAARHLAHVPRISFCINAGGDLVAGFGPGHDPSPWTIGIEDPRHTGRVAATVELTCGGLATSGTAARGAHLRDPRDGAPISRPGSATVWGPSLLWADVWATALFVDPAVATQTLEGEHPAYRHLVL
ncbi:FAD:protein FMN transferase [Knoellia koreensis]